MKELTVIIPFLNEGIEIENTVQSIRETAGEAVDILLINDCSQDNHDYEHVARKYDASYHFNEERQGVAKSRDIGVSLIDTPYFILIDGHMRFYHNDWWTEVVECLKKNDRAVYCCQCRVLNTDGTMAHDMVAYGAYIEMEGHSFDQVLEAQWITVDAAPEDPAPDIPCVLGASYALSKRYWEHIRGLSGLRYYGSDEPYLSLKVWLEGGKCTLLKNIEIGHIFRDKPPYSVVMPDAVFNKLFIAATLLPDQLEDIQSKLKKSFPSEYYLSQSMLSKQATMLQEHRSYYSDIFSKDYQWFNAINSKGKRHVGQNDQLKAVLRGIASSLASAKRPRDYIGLMLGEMGELVFLYEYAAFSQNASYSVLADERLSALLKRAADHAGHYNLYHGAAGLGVALNYLNQKEYIEFDVVGYFSDIEPHMEHYMRQELTQGRIGFLQQALGIEYYFSQKKEYSFSNQGLILQAIDQCMEESGSLASYSNGLAGALSFLLYSWARGYKGEEMRNAIVRCTDLIAKNISVEKKLTYMSGDLVNAYTLLKVALEFGDSPLRAMSLS